jgi:glycosyltransferase 2 family protein
MTSPGPVEEQAPRRLATPWRALLGGGAAVALFAWVLHAADLGQALALLHQLGPLLPLALLPNVATTLLEAGGWAIAARGIGARAPFRGLVSMRLIADAVALSVPSGPLVTEGLQPYLLHRRCGLSYGDALATLVARKIYAVASHGVCLALAVAWAYPSLARASYRLLHGPLLPAILLIAAAALITASLSLAAMSFRGRLGGRLWERLRRLPLGSLRGWIERRGASFLATDSGLAHLFGRGPRALLLPIPYFLLVWVVRAGENFLLLRMVGVEVGFRELMALEPSLVIVRAVFSILPGGLGVQDLGALLFLDAMGVANASAVGAAYVLLRRGKELFWIAVGYALLAFRKT